jgi:hypothetical protein
MFYSGRAPQDTDLTLRIMGKFNFRWILQQENDLGLQPSVTEEDIKTCEKRAEELESRLKTRTSEWPYLVLEPEVKKEEHVFLN